MNEFNSAQTWIDLLVNVERFTPEELRNSDYVRERIQINADNMEIPCPDLQPIVDAALALGSK